jgi:hypothetical protein
MARLAKTMQDESLLTAALEGLEFQKRRIEEQIQEVRSLLGKGTGRRRGRPPRTSLNGKPARRTLSDAARRRIAAAQKRRWAEYRKSAAAGS